MAQVNEVQTSLQRVRGRIADGAGNVGRLTRDSVFQAELEAVRASLRALQEKYLGRRPTADPG
jgi:hypothetical protein